MTALFRCSACWVVVEAIKTSGNCLCPPKGWGIAHVELGTLSDDDGMTDTIESDEVHLCPDCMGNTDVDALMKAGLPPPPARRKAK